MRQAYDYWQDQPGSYRRPPPAWHAGRQGRVKRSTEPAQSGARVALARRHNGRFPSFAHRGARSARPSAEAAADLDADARFSRLRGTRCGAGILKTVRLVSNLDVWHTVRISTARQPMEVNRRDACRTAGTLAPVAAGRLQDCLVSKRQRSSIESKPGSRSLDDVPTPDDGPTHAPTLANQRRPFCRLPCPVCTLHCRFTYIAKHRVAAFSQPEFTYRYICIPYDLA